MSPEELRALADDIKKTGQRQPVAIIERTRRRPDGTFHVKDPPLQEVLDGISRLDAMDAAGIDVIGKDGELAGHIARTVFDADEVDPVAYVISANIHRRHLSAEQKRELIAKLLKAQPDKSNNAIAKQVKADDKTVATVRREMERRSEIPNVSTRTDSKGRKQPSSKTRKPEPKPKRDHFDAVDWGLSEVKPRADKPKPRDDIAPASTGEIVRKDAEIEELRNAKRRLEIENTGLRSEVEELRNANAGLCKSLDEASARFVKLSAEFDAVSPRCRPMTGSTFPRACGGPRHDRRRLRG
jgi:hypothetical protein